MIGKKKLHKHVYGGFAGMPSKKTLATIDLVETYLDGDQQLQIVKSFWNEK